MREFIDIAILAAKEAAKIHKKYFNTDFEVKTKGKSYDLVTIADIEAEKAVVSLIRSNFPDHNILAEEEKYSKTDSKYQWIVDPLDGTNNFSNKIPFFSVSIALAKDGEAIVGVVYDVMRNELFSAQKGKGSFLNGQKISVNSASELKQAILITGFYYDRGAAMIENLEDVKQFLQKEILGIRRFGSAALDLCYVGCGRAAGFWEFELNAWDFAAGKLIVEEAGGKVTGRDEGVISLKKSFVVASNSKIHSQMLEVISR